MYEFMIKRTGKLPPIGQALFTGRETQEFIVPEDVYEVHSVVIGRAEGLGGAGLSWRNNIPVTPGQKLVIILDNFTVIRADSVNGPNLIVARGSVARSTAPGKGGKAADAINDGGGTGGNGGTDTYPSGGGAGGYTGNGGSGGSGGAGSVGMGGGGGGGGRYTSSQGARIGAQGGGVYPYGQGADGQRGGSFSGLPTDNGHRGGVGSLDKGQVRSATYGGGGYGISSVGGGEGCARIIWGANRAFPNLNTQDM